jgi:hypothetical protein
MPTLCASPFCKAHLTVLICKAHLTVLICKAHLTVLICKAHLTVLICKAHLTVRPNSPASSPSPSLLELMALPKLTVKLFPPKPGKSYSASGNLLIPIADVHAFAEWLLGQSGDYDDYLKDNVVRLLAFEYQNTARSGNTYRTVQLRDPADLEASQSSAGGSHRPSNTPAAGWTPLPADSDGGFDGDLPF